MRRLLWFTAIAAVAACGRAPGRAPGAPAGFGGAGGKGGTGGEERTQGTNACGVLGPDLPEICGNGLDDDCDGRIDPAELCTMRCDDLDPDADLPRLDCCLHTWDWPGAIARTQLSSTCREDPSLPACESLDRPCLQLEAGAACSKICRDGTCQCLRVAAGDTFREDPACGFETICARQDCDGRALQPCYSGPPPTLGKGVCHGGVFSCEGSPGARAWGACQGEQLPSPEICDNDLDDDCDGLVDERDGATGKTCAHPGQGDACVPAGEETCNGGDDDCDGLVDEDALPACGRCDGPCYEQELLGPHACDEGTCEGVEITHEGMLHRTGSSRAVYTRIFDSHYATASWQELAWSATGSGKISVSVRTAPTMEALATARPCATDTSAPISLASCAFGGRFAEVELSIMALGAEDPQVGSLRLGWTRP